MNTRTRLRQIAAAVAIAGVTTGATALAAGTAAAVPGDDAGVCLPYQVTTKLVPGEPGMSQRNAALELTAKPGIRCTTPGGRALSMSGADNALLKNNAPRNAPGILLQHGSSAYIPLHWTVSEASANQQTPTGLSLDVPGSTHPSINVQWDQGPVDANPTGPDHTVDAGAPVAGKAPRN